MISLCRKDVLRNHYFIPVLSVIDLIYIVTYFVPEKIFYEVHRGTQGIYALGIALLIPFLLYMRYGDDNAGIIENVIRPNVLDIRKYYIYYLCWILILVLGFAAAAAVATAFPSNGSPAGSLLLTADILILSVTLIQLFVVLLGIVKKFIYVFLAYLLCILALLLINAPDSFLWFIYEPEVEGLMLNHWIGKGVLLLIVTMLNCARILFVRLSTSGYSAIEKCK